MIKKKRNLYFGRITLSFLLATLIFLGGFLVSQILSYGVSDKIDESQESLRYEFFNLMLQKEILSETCNIREYREFFDQLDEMGRYMEILETRLGKDDKSVLNQKKVYSLLLTQHFLFIEERNEKCEDDFFPTILFFYSNEEEASDSATFTGRILSSLKNQDNNIMVYSFDYHLDSDIISILKKKYNVTQPNTIIINEEIKLHNIQHISEIKEDYLYP